MPEEIPVDTKDKAVILEPALRAALPSLIPSFEYIDVAYEEDPLAHFKNLGESVFQVEQDKALVACSLICNEDTALATEMLVVFSAFSDCAPLSTPEKLYEYVKKKDAGFIAKQVGRPGSWNQTTKSSVAHDLLEAQGRGMPVLTIYSPIPPRAYTADERKLIRKGNLSPAAKTAENAIAEARKFIYSKYDLPRINTLHLHGESLGDNAIGTAAVLTERDDELCVGSVTAQELIMGPRGIVDLAKRYTIMQYVGEPSERQISPNAPRLAEPKIRQDIDAHGSEAATYVRVVKAMTKFTHLLGLTEPAWLSEKIEYLVDQGVPVTVALAENSSLSYQTPQYLPKHRNLALMTFRALEGQKIGHLADEHVTLGAITTALGVMRDS